MPVFGVDKLARFAVALLEAGGATSDEASLVGRSLVESNLCGYDSHGVMRIPYYVEQLERGELVSGAEFRVLRQSASHLAADGNWGLGRVQAGELCRRLIDQAARSASAAGTLIHSGHIGRLGEYCERAAAAGLVSLVMVNTHGVARRVAPPGGTAPRLGTNPIAFGVPHADEPLVVDFSTSATAEGKVRVRRIAGQPCPEGWLLDSQGQPTTDPNVLYADPPGTIRPMGGDQPYKGFGLALVIELLAGALSGGVCAREAPPNPNGNCVFMMMFNPDQFGGASHFAAETAMLLSYVRSCPRAEGVERIDLPGDPERQVAARRRHDGIPLDNDNWLQLVRLAGQLNVPVPE